MGKSPKILRKVLLIDGITCLVIGLALGSLAELLSEPLGLPVPLLRYAGLALLPFAALLVHAARGAAPSRALLLTIIVLNGVWVADSALLLLSGWVAPTWLGQAFVIAQAVVVALITELEYAGLQASSDTTGAVVTSR